MKRITYALLMAYRFRRKLAAALQDAPSCRYPWEISVESLVEKGVSVIVLDFDGLLAPHGDDSPVPEMANWIERCIKQFGAERIFVLTNKPSSARMNSFRRQFPRLRLISGVRKKPYPDGLYEISRMTQRQTELLMLLDDRLMTGVLAACVADTQVTYVTCPLVRISRRPVQELFFMALRGLERSIIRVMK